MSRLDELPPDQRAALSLLLRQRKSYAEVAGLLGIDEQAVRERAHAALAALAPQDGGELPASGRDQIGDYLLGQQPGERERERTLRELRESEPANAWARGLAGELAALSPAQPAPIPPLRARPEHAARSDRAREPWQQSSRRGGAILLAVLAVVVIVVVVLLTTGGGSSHSKGSRTTAKTSAAAAGSSATPKLDNEIPLTSPEPKSTSVGVVDVVSEGSKLAFLIEARNIPPAKGFYYAIWLYNSPTSFLALTKTSNVSSKHTIGGISALPGNAGSYHEILLTTQTEERPTHPGPVVLHGPFSLH